MRDRATIPFAFGVRWQAKRHTALAGAGTALPGRPARAKPRLAGTPRSAGAPVSHSYAMVFAQLRRKVKCSIGSIGCIGSFPRAGVFFGAIFPARAARSRLRWSKAACRASSPNPRGGAKAERVIREEVERLGWNEGELCQRPKGDPAKLAMAGRLRRETTLALPRSAARLHSGAWKSRNAKLYRWRKANETPKP